MIYLRQDAGGGGGGGTPPETTEQKLDKLVRVVESVSARNAQLEGMFVTPEYLAFLNNGGQPGGRPAAGTTRQEPPAATGRPLSQMTDEEIEALPKREIIRLASVAAAQAVSADLGPRVDKQEVEAATRDVQAAAVKYEDFFTYRREMLQLSRAHPTLEAEDLYLMASRYAGKEPKPRGRAALKAESAGGTGSEAGGGRTRSEAPGVPAGARTQELSTRKAGARGANKFDTAFDAAWKASGLES